jgi:hypothetical protein
MPQSHRLASDSATRVIRSRASRATDVSSGAPSSATVLSNASGSAGEHRCDLHEPFDRHAAGAAVRPTGPRIAERERITRRESVWAKLPAKLPERGTQVDLGQYSESSCLSASYASIALRTERAIDIESVPDVRTLTGDRGSRTDDAMAPKMRSAWTLFGRDRPAQFPAR